MTQIQLITEADLKKWGVPPTESIEINHRLAGGISTLRSGFVVGWVEKSIVPIVCFLFNPDGQPIARFDKDRTVTTYRDLDRAELEAVQGMKTLVLRWS